MPEEPRQSCRHLLLVGVEQRPTTPLCMLKVTSNLRCPWHDGAGYATCEGYQAGPALVHILPPGAPDADAFDPHFMDTHPAFAEIVVDFMAPDWRRGDVGPRSGLRRTRVPSEPPSTSVRRFFQWRLGQAPPSPPSAHVAPEPDSVLELGSEAGEPSPPPCIPSPQAGTHRRVAVTSRLQPSAAYIGEMRLQDRRGHCRVDWASGGSRADRPPLSLRWRVRCDSGHLLLGGESAGRAGLVYATRLRQVPGEDTLASHEDVVCALGLQDGHLLWRWRNLSSVCPPQVVGDLVLLRRRDALWAVDVHTGRIQWRCEGAVEHPEAAAVAEGRAVFHGGKRFRAVELRTGRLAWEVEASHRAPRPAAAHGRVVLAGAEDIRVVRSSNGTVNWRVVCSGPDNRTPAISDRHVVFWTWDGMLHAHDVTSGRRAWSVRATTFYPGGDPLLVDGRVYHRDGDLGDASLCALDVVNGRLLWRAPLDESLSNNVAVRGRVVYVQNTHDEVIALDRDSGGLLWRLQGPVSGLAAAPGGLVMWGPGAIVCCDLS